VFTPEHKRRWGYYVLPILFRDRLVGRIEPRIDRADACVRVLGSGREEGFRPGRTEGFVDAMRVALRPISASRAPTGLNGATPRRGEAALPQPPVTKTSDDERVRGAERTSQPSTGIDCVRPFELASNRDGDAHD
jgi:hypothetical protein